MFVFETIFWEYNSAQVVCDPGFVGGGGGASKGVHVAVFCKYLTFSKKTNLNKA